MSCPYAFTSSAEEHQEKAKQQQQDGNDHESSPVPSSPPQDGTLTPMQALELAKSSCPAFKSSCPFRGVQDAHSMRKALENLPPSHLLVQKDSNGGATNSDKSKDKVRNEKDGLIEKGNENSGSIKVHQSLRVALQHVHVVSQSLRSMNSNEDGQDENKDPHMTENSNSKQPSLGSLNSSFSNKKYEISGGICPYKTIDNSTLEETKFVNVMEDFSFNAILAKLIHNEEISSSSLQDLNSIAVTDTTLPTTTTAGTSTPTVSSTKTEKSNATKRRSLSASLKVGTAKSHSSAESVHFVKEFIKGNIDQTLYSKLISNLYWVYHTMEKELDRHAEIEFPTLNKRELYRKVSLQDDLEFFYKDLDFDDFTSNDEEMEERLKLKIPPSPATKDYIHRIQYIAEKEPLLLLSHAYTRYLGDLSGGKVLARVAKRALNLKSKSGDTSNKDEPCDGLAFYHFAEIESAKKFKDEYRSALDNLEFLSIDQIERLVAEANVAFVLNMRIFEELDVLGGVKGASVRDYGEATCYYEDCIKDQLEKKEKGVGYEDEGEGIEVEKTECPFAKLGGPNPHILMNNFPTSSHEERQRAEKKDKNSSTLKKSKQNNVERCPWPFIFFHDPKTGFQDWQTWMVIGLVLCWVWSTVTP